MQQFDIEAVTADTRQQWAASPELRAGFGNDFARFAAYERAHARGGVHSVRPTVVRASPTDTRSTVEMLRGARLSFDAAIAAGSAVKLDATAAGVLGRVSGYGAIFNATPNRRGFRLMANAFTRSRHAVPLPMLWCHAQPVGRWDEVHQDERGLRLHGELNLDVELGRRALAHIKHGDTLGLSVGFTVAKTAGAVIDRDGVLEVHDADLLEVSITPVPAEPAARIDSLQ